MDTGIAGKTALITGAGSGIGRAAALALAAEGVRVVATDIDAAGARRTADEAAASGGEAMHLALDVTARQQALDACAAVTRRWGALDILVNNAGWEKVARFTESDPVDWERNLQINLAGGMIVTHAFLPAMIESGRGGRIVFISSDAGRMGSPGETIYSAAKAGVLGFCKALARETLRHGITANCVSPGPVDTPFFRALPERTQTLLTAAIPMKRLASPDEVAAAVVFFASRQAGYVTGQVLSISGGLTMLG